MNNIFFFYPVFSHEEEIPKENDWGNVNQYSDGNWYHLTKDGDVRWWRIFVPEDLWHYQDLAIQTFFQGLIKNEYEKWNLKEAYGIDIKELYTWANNRQSK